MASEASYLQSQAFGKSWLPPRGLSMAFLGLAWNILRVGVAHDISGRSYQVPRELFFFFQIWRLQYVRCLTFSGVSGVSKIEGRVAFLDLLHALLPPTSPLFFDKGVTNFLSAGELDHEEITKTIKQKARDISMLRMSHDSLVSSGFNVDGQAKSRTATSEREFGRWRVKTAKKVHQKRCFLSCLPKILSCGFGWGIYIYLVGVQSVIKSLYMAYGTSWYSWLLILMLSQHWGGLGQAWQQALWLQECTADPAGWESLKVYKRTNLYLDISTSLGVAGRCLVTWCRSRVGYGYVWEVIQSGL